MKRSFLLLLGVSFLAASCNRGPLSVENHAVGYAQGTYYSIKYITSEDEDRQPAFDSIFKYIDLSMSTYLDSSTISIINEGDTLVEVDPLFEVVLERSIEIAKETDGRFDPTVGPLVAYWGFGKQKPSDIDPSGAEAVLERVGYENIIREGKRVGLPEGFQLDFNGIAQGYTVDVISEFLESTGVERYMVEVGGEVRARGKNINDEYWRIGIDKPSEELDQENRFQVVVELKNKSLATSGNYRKFWVDEETGVKYAHTIDPFTGKPARNRLLSISVIADECMDADAYATACMVMGTEKALEFIRSKPSLEAYLVSSGENSEWEVTQTEDFGEYVLD